MMRKLLILLLSIYHLNAIAIDCSSLMAYVPVKMASNTTCHTDLLTAEKGKRTQVNIAIQYISADAELKLPFHRNYVDENDDVSLIIKDNDYDLGNLASEKINNKDIESRFSKDNLVPMPVKMNRKGGVWHLLEEHEIQLANKLGGLVSISGVSQGRDGKQQTFFKILVQPELESSISFLIEELDNNGTIGSAISSISCIEKHVDVNFRLPGIEKDEESSAAFNVTLLSHGNNPIACEG